jgi:hypothetical protein
MHYFILLQHFCNAIIFSPYLGLPARFIYLPSSFPFLQSCSATKHIGSYCTYSGGPVVNSYISLEKKKNFQARLTRDSLAKQVLMYICIAMANLILGNTE